MKFKVTKTHIVIKLTRRERAAIDRIIDLGLEDVNQNDSGSPYARDAKVANEFLGVPTAYNRGLFKKFFSMTPKRSPRE